MVKRHQRIRWFQQLTYIERCRARTLQKGSATVEYTIVTLIVITALFVPLGGEGSLSGVGLLLQGLRNFQMHSSFLLSLP